MSGFCPGVELFRSQNEAKLLLVSPSGITLDTLFKSWDLLLHPPYCDWLQRAGQAALLYSVLYRWDDKRSACQMTTFNLQQTKLGILFPPRALPSSLNWLYDRIYFILLISELPTLNATLLGSLSVSTCSIRCPTAWRVLWHTSPAAPWRASSGWTHGSSEQLLHKEGTNTVTYNPDSYYETGQLIEHKKMKDFMFHLINGLLYSSM